MTKYNIPVQVPVGVSNKHIHLSQAHLEQLFGKGHKLTELKPLYQPGHFACKEVVTIAGPKGIIPNVRVLGPLRSQTQVEISRSDSFALGIKPPLRDSGDLEGSAGCILMGPKGTVVLEEGVIMAARHIHLGVEEAKVLQLKDKDRVNISVGGERGLIFNNVLVRVAQGLRLEFHVDIDEANAGFLASGDYAYITEKSEEKEVSTMSERVIQKI
ncbi:phosphate propanoyltransferase [Heliorestis acidaminivorans]|uniref:Phosphate propanoyltransferase n=1 Tax=Heliorestis acidaminivorans TaxID=553427 RepID=A0A6I0EWP2_9FIRM|nr:phosphate propanoyltransferase [Heliorestis acidaminivorans]KAB2952567.1 phosphate propanoyltransferase [Heliorestis acidaminivorans]